MDERKRIDIRSRINKLSLEINSELEHGECFYNKEMMDKFFSKLNEMKQLSIDHLNLYNEKNK